MQQRNWHTSSYSSSTSPNCVEVAEGASTVAMRDTRHRHLGQLTVSPGEWAAFLTAVRNEDF